ncbi:alpha/beta hydrolase [Pseudonocardia sp. DR1-2]|uniref:alpha/beta fold hydrolase n=1 Tax=Pseudonocardia sp. DR1-2 TaxID=2951168 RepID=UPI002043B702|nr:alpha/beta hydrolase [Pseudonocardia sp. DR1-2]MCM3849002.1 alpha/beta hydrolase [Pseudonocardia sp. DR1-2]
MVLLHSAGLDLSYWDRQIEVLRTDRDVIAPDLPGHGRTSGVPEDWTIGTMVEFVRTVLEQAQVDRVHLVGLSLGGMLAQATALAAPDSVASLTLIDTASSFAPAGRAAMRTRAGVAREHGMPAVLESLFDHWFTPATRIERPDLLERVTTTVLGDDPLIHAAMWEMIAGFEITEELPGIACPSLAIVGEHDSSSPVSSARLLVERIPDARLRVVPHTAHLAPLERPDVVTRHITDFLDTVA